MTVVAPAGARAASQAQIDQAVRTGAAWLRAQQNQDGLIRGFNGDWATTTLAAAGINAADVQGPGVLRSLQDYWQDEYSGPSWTGLPSAVGPGQIGKAILIAHSAGLDPTRISPDVNLAASLASTYSWTDGSFAGTKAVNALGFALLAMAHLGLPQAISQRAVQDVLASQHPDGGWTYDGGGNAPGDTDMTGAALAMICSGGIDAGDPRVAAGLAFLRAREGEDGAITTTAAGVRTRNAPTHAWALTGIQACGQDPQSPAWTTTTDHNPIDFALSLQVTTGNQAGAIRYVPDGTATDSRNINATEALVRALSGHLFSADPPTRSDPGRSARRPAPAVADGTIVPVALTIEDGTTPARMCAVRVASGTPLRQVLQAAQVASAPAGCVTGIETSGPWVTALNGAHATDPTGGWVADTPTGPVRGASDQPVRFGDVVRLRIAPGPLPGELRANAPTVAFGSLEPGASGTQTITFTAAFAPVRVTSMRIDGDAGFALARDGCTDQTIPPGGSCTIDARYTATTQPTSTAAVTLTTPGAEDPTTGVTLTAATAPQPAPEPQPQPEPQREPKPRPQPKPRPKTAKRPAISVRKATQTINAARTAALATLVCPKGPTRCKVTVARRVTVTIAKRRYTATIIAPKTIAAGKKATLRVRLSKAAARRLKRRKATVKAKVTIASAGKKTTRSVKVAIRGR